MAESIPAEGSGPEVSLGGTSHDIFLSYTHVDNFPDRPDVDTLGWVDRFTARLGTALWKRLGERVRIWRDEGDLKRADKLTPTIHGVIEHSALFLILVSNRYLRSESCANEVRWIEEELKRPRPNPWSGERVYPVLLYRIPEPKRPSICRDRVGFDFHNSLDEKDEGRPLDPQRELDQFDKAFERLVVELVQALTQLRAAAAARPATPPARLRPPNTYHVLITGTPGMRLRQRDRLRQALSEDGVEVTDERVPPPYEARTHEEAFTRLLDGVDLSIHLVDEQPGPAIENNASLCFPEAQAQIAHGYGISQLVIVPEFFDLEALEVPSHQAFLDKLSKGVWPGDGVAARLTVAKARQDEAILELIRHERDKAQRLRQPSAATGSSVFIELNTKDLQTVGPLFEFLERQNLEPITIPSTKTSPTECRSMFVEGVTRSTALIIVYGNATLDWVKSRALNAIRLIYERELPLKPIVAALPPAKQLSGLAFLQCPIVDCMAGFDEGSLVAILQGGRP